MDELNRKEQRQIRAVYTDDTIRVYQAYCPAIAEEAVALGTFGPHFKRTRMTWIKPSFLWMMYRCGWATKEGQERVLAMDIKRTAFDEIVKNAVLSKFHPQVHGTYEQWKRLLQESEIRCQWDPERDIHGNPLPYRSIQLGISGQAVTDYVENWIVSLEDITDYVRQLDALRHQGADITALLPPERLYP